MTPEQLAAAVDAAWASHVKGTWSSTDKRIFELGFLAGVRHGAKEIASGISGTENNQDAERERPSVTSA